ETHTHEEEDLFITSGLPLKRDGKCLAMVNVIEETVSRQLNACKSPSQKKRAIEDIEPLQTDLDLEEGYCKAVLCAFPRPQGKGLDLARKHIASCLVELQSILKTEEFLKSNRRFGTSPTPPRAMKLLSWKKFEGALQFVVEFQKLQPDLVARSHLLLLLLQDGKLYGHDPMFDVAWVAISL
nr:hypothetical protein [Tanacetum cinerariifolium]